MDKVLEHLLFDGADDDEVLAQAATHFGLARKRLRHILLGNQFNPNQQISQTHSDCDDALPLACAATP